MSTHTFKETSIESSGMAVSGEFPALSAYQARGRIDSAQPGFSGVCESTSLFDWLQLLHLGRRDARMSIQNHDGQQALLWCREGDLIDAECEGLRGEAAVYRTLAWSSGDITLDFSGFERERRVLVGTMQLLLQAAVRADSATGEPSLEGAPSTLRASADLPLEDVKTIQSGASAGGHRRRWRLALAAVLGLSVTAAWLVGNSREQPRSTGESAHAVTASVTDGAKAPAASPSPASVSLSDTPPSPPLVPPGAPETKRARVRPVAARPLAQAPANASPVKPSSEEAHEASGARTAVRVIDDAAPRVQVIDDLAPRVEVIE